ncbi:MAG: polysaccharide deacetylase [Colwellia sp.]|jgi:peptidoglycan/xylan/chitin deacetylase (PgdA/CDA1 family)|nr:MAG: polysaccharide deacetylase [Colwellia sp.]
MRNKIRYFIRSKLLPNSLFLIDGKKESKSLYLTFDDGPVQGITENLLDLLDKYQVKATFFIIGQCAKSNPEIIKEIHHRGHKLANHTYTHPAFHKISLPEKINEITSTNTLIKELTNENCKIFRAPQGRWDLKLLMHLFRLKITAVHWSRDSMDFRKEPPAKIVKRLIDEPVKSGDILLFHDDDSRCIEVLETLIPYWQSQGFSINALENK